MKPTKVTKLLDSQGIQYHLLPHSEPVFTVAKAAAQRGVVLDEMVKSILLRESGSDRFVMACVTGDSRLDPRAVRAHLPGTWKRLSFASAEEITTNTGYHRGSVAPLGLPDRIPVLFDVAIAHCTKVSISSGDPMAGIELAVSDLIQLCKATIVPIAEIKA